jgi:hypothetical protein
MSNYRLASLHKKDRVLKLGSVGVALSAWFVKDDYRLFDMAVADQINTVGALVAAGNLRRAAACSVLMCECIVQVPINKAMVAELVMAAIETTEYGCEHAPSDMDAMHKQFRLEAVNGDTSKIFEKKSHPGAMNKVNVYWGDVWTDIKKYNSSVAAAMKHEPWRLCGAYEDSAVAIAIYACALSPFYDSPYRIAVGLGRCRDVAKAVTDVLKALGVNGYEHGALLCEADTLAGRGVRPVDWEQETNYRITPELAAEKVSSFFTEDELRKAVRDIYELELSKYTVEFAELDDFWSRRWLWCVNGSHSRVLERNNPKYVLDIPGQMHRRVFIENLEDEPVTQWDGVSYYSRSEKLENGKSRALFASDSVSYVCFEHLLRPVEKAWRGVKVILDPGGKGHLGMVLRQRLLRAGAGVNLMLDYDDFNSQHSTRAMQIVFEELVSYTGYDAGLGGKLVSSFEHSLISTPDGLKRSCGSLMSGHRGTTFINSILNLAYLAMADKELFRMRTMHVGDDVYVACATHAEAARVLDNVKRCKLRMNAMKQSVGAYTAEFLRVATSRDASYGYVARSIAACVEGNWANAARLDPVEHLRTMVSHAWTIENRSICTPTSLMLTSAICRYSGLKRGTVEKLVRGTLALGNGPVRRRDNCYESIEIKLDKRIKEFRRSEVIEKVDELGGKGYAVGDYLAKHVAPVEIAALSCLGTSVGNVMVEASYSKSLSRVGDYARTDSGLIVISRRVFTSGTVSAEEIMRSRKTIEDVGALDGYPIIHLVKSGFTTQIVRDLLTLLGVSHGDNPWRTAFTEKSYGGAVNGVLSYSDASSLLARTDAGVLTCRHPMFV